jgi:hypothetical protein
VRGKSQRVCPLICEHGYQPDGDTCSKIICKSGYELGDDDVCVKGKSRKPEAKQNSKPDESQPLQGKSAAIEPQLGNRPMSQSDRDFLHNCGATSCSQAMRGCMRKTAIMGRDSSICTFKYDACLQTGSFVGRFCSLHGLARN